MELRIESFKTPEKISWNYEQLKNELIDKVAHYEAVVYDDEQIQSAKKDKAALNKLKKALNDERLRQEREYMQPFNEFKAQVNEIISIIDKPVQAIDTQVKAYEEKQKAIKKDIIIGIYEIIGFPAWVDFGKIFDEKWLNATVKEKAIEEALRSKYEQINAEMATLASLPEFGFEATEEYKRTLDINRAIAEGRRLAEIQKQKIAFERAEEATKKATEAFENLDEAIKKAIPIETPDKQWLSFRALLSVEDATALKNLFLSRKIKFESI